EGRARAVSIRRDSGSPAGSVQREGAVQRRPAGRGEEARLSGESSRLLGADQNPRLAECVEDGPLHASGTVQDPRRGGGVLLAAAGRASGGTSRTDDPAPALPGPEGVARSGGLPRVSRRRTDRRAAPQTFGLEAIPLSVSASRASACRTDPFSQAPAAP